MLADRPSEIANSPAAWGARSNRSVSAARTITASCCRAGSFSSYFLQGRAHKVVLAGQARHRHLAHPGGRAVPHRRPRRAGLLPGLDVRPERPAPPRGHDPRGGHLAETGEAPMTVPNEKEKTQSA